jgi:hypothetical protein
MCQKDQMLLIFRMSRTNSLSMMEEFVSEQIQGCIQVLSCHEALDGCLAAEETRGNRPGDMLRLTRLNTPAMLGSWKDREERMIEKIVSGGQTGVDRAALDLALELGLPCGGWCPKGRKAEDGTITPRYPLRETPSDDYAQRTEWNVRDSDGTLVLTVGPLTEGTAFTFDVAARLKKPCLVVDLARPMQADSVRSWLATHRIKVLNVAGPRESKSPGIHEQARQALRRILEI